MYALSSLGKEAELIEKTTEETERNVDNALLEPPPASDVSMDVASTNQPGPPSNVRRLRRARRDSLGTELDLIDETVSRGDGSSGTDGSNGHTNLDRAARQLARAQKGERSRSPRTEGTSGTREDSNAGAVELANGSLPATDASATTPEGLVIDVLGKNPNRAARTLERARGIQVEAAAVLARPEVANDPVIGALNRHLNMMTQQLGTAHRLVGRVAAERDALRQQLADLQGIPVDEIVVTSTGAASERHAERHPERHAAKPQPPSAMARFNYFRHEDIQVMRRRRQVAALCVLSLVLVLWLLSRMGIWQMPDNVSKDSLSGLPLIGELMSYFLAGWVFYRIVRVGGKGVKWVFPTDQKRRRR